MRSPPVLSDEEAEALVEQSRAAGTEIVRHHLENHVRNNPGRSSDYVTWIATLHPENVDVSVDHRFLIPGNPWWTIYEQLKTDLPSATAIAIEVENENVVIEPSLDGGSFPPKPHLFRLGSPIDGLVGIIFIATACLGVFVCEITSFALYLVGFVFYWIAKLFSPPNALTGLFYSLLMIVYYVLALGDSICLLCSVLVTESLACVGWPLTFLFGGISMANHRHQYIRRTCHLIRWAFRAPFMEPPRHLSMLCLDDGDGKDVVELNEPTIEALVVPQTITDPCDQPGAYEVLGEHAAVKDPCFCK